MMNSSSRDDLYHELFGVHYRPYYPTLTLDSSGYTIQSNDVFKWMLTKLSSMASDTIYLSNFADYFADFDKVIGLIVSSSQHPTFEEGEVTPELQHAAVQGARTFSLLRFPFIFSSSWGFCT